MEAAIVTLESYLGILLARELYSIAMGVKGEADRTFSRPRT
jgi:hypothetical protein